MFRNWGLPPNLLNGLSIGAITEGITEKAFVDDQADSAQNMKQKSPIFNTERSPVGLLSTLTTHHHRRCPYCHGEVYREKREGLAKLTLAIAIRPYRCNYCNRLHYGFCF
jgi:hypothetical protein